MSSISLKKSIWSSSTFSITSMVGKGQETVGIFTGLRHKNSGPPTRMLPPMSPFKNTTHGDGWIRHPARRISVSMDVVVVFPWVPETAMASL